MKTLKTIFYLVFIFTTYSFSFQIRTQFISEQEKELIQSIVKNDSIPFSMLSSLFLAEGEIDSIKINRYEDQFRDDLSSIERSIASKTSIKKKVKVIFDFLRDKYLEQSRIFALTESLFKEHYYNNSTAAGLFYDACTRFKIPIVVQRTSVHVYFTFIENGDTVRVEPCHSDGFDVKSDDGEFQDIFRFCNSSDQRYFTRQEFDVIVKEYQRKLVTSAKFILALRYYSDGNAFFEAKDYKRAFLAFEKATIIEPNFNIFQHQYAVAFYMFSDDETKSKEYYFPMFERFIINLGINNEILNSNFMRIERYALFMRENREYVRAQLLLDNIRNYNGLNKEIRKQIHDIIAKHNYFWAYNLFELGNYGEAYAKMKEVVSMDSITQKYLEAALKFSLRFSTYLIEQGQSKSAKSLLDSIVEKYITYPFVKESYVKSINNIVFNDNLLRDDPIEAIRILKRSNVFDPHNKTTINYLANAHHNYALKKMKTKNYGEARIIVLEGLGFSPNDSYLKRDLQYIDSLKK